MYVTLKWGGGGLANADVIRGGGSLNADSC